MEAKNTSAPKKIEIEFLYLDLDGCTRCRGTDANLETAIRTVQSVLEASGNIINVRKVLVGSEDMVRSAEFVSSPTIRVNGRDIALELRETPCDSCTEACGCKGSVNCRVWLHGGKEYDEAPVPLIVNALLTEVYGTQNRAHSVAPEKFVVPANLKRFFAAKEKQATSCCSHEERATGCTSTEKGASCEFPRTRIGSDLWMQMSRPANRRISEGVWNDFSGRLRSFVSKRVKEPADADDIVQEIFLRIHASLPTLDDEARLPAWIFAIARNSIADHFRRKSRAAGILSGDFDLPLPSAESHVDSTALSELSRCLEPMMKSLPKPYDEAIRLTEFGGMTQAAAAKHIGLSTSGMKTRVQRARQRLKHMLLKCCEIEPDRRGGIVTYKPRTGGCNSCSEDAPTSACESSVGKGQKRSST